MPITKDQLRLAGWISIISAALKIPDYILDPRSVLLALLATAVEVYLLLALRRWLHFRFHFYDVDNYIPGLIVLWVVVTVLSNAWSPSSPLTFGYIITLVVIICAAILSAAFYVKLLSLRGDLYGLLKPLCYSGIGTWVCMLSIFPTVLLWGVFSASEAQADRVGDILITLIVLIDVGSYVILGIIFFRAAGEPAVNIRAEYRPPYVLKPAENRGPAFCTQCGAGVNVDDQFCSSCGYQIGQKASEV